VGLTENLLVSHAPPTAPTAFSAWLSAHADELGREWASEIRRHFE